MFIRERKLVITGLCTIIAFSSAIAQKATWAIEPVSIQTRWSTQVNPKSPLPEYPRPQMMRSGWTSLNGLWQYTITDKNIELPKTFDGKILVPYPVESSLSGVAKPLNPNQLLWYKRNIVKPVLKPGERLLLHFGAVDWESTVYVNSKEVGIHSGGYQSFSFDVTDALTDGNNELLVRVADPTDQGPNPHGKQVLNPLGIMYTPSSGIWQTVWLEKVPEVYIKSLKITPDVDAERLKVRVDVKGDDKDYVVDVITKDVTKRGFNIGSFYTDFDIPVKRPKLWSPDNPYLYDLTIRIYRKGKKVDEVKSYFGMRKIEIKKDEKGIERIFLNNKYTYNLGTLDQGYWPDGLYTAPTDKALLFDIQAAKAMGFNTIRKHIKVEPARWYYHCDKLGMLVWQDMVNPGSTTNDGKTVFEKECKETIEQLFNSPSIVTWVLFNEGWGAYDQGRLAEWIKKLDSTRLLNGHTGAAIVNGKVTDPGPVFEKSVNSDMTDIHSYPSPAIPVHMPGKAMSLGEFGGIAVVVEGHVWDDIVTGFGYGNVVSPPVMERNYSVMMDSLRLYQQQGLSASIYTQPYDVEAEQNGLLTYDREVIKLPIHKIRSLNAKVWPATLNYSAVGKGLKIKVADTLQEDYAYKLKKYRQGQRDSALLRSLVISAYAQKQKEMGKRATAEYLKVIKSPFKRNNVWFLWCFTQSTSDSAYYFIRRNISRVNSILGEDQAEGRLAGVIADDYIHPYIPQKEEPAKPVWSRIEKNVIEKFGELGREAVLKEQVLYAINRSDSILLSKTFEAWVENYGVKRAYLNSSFLNAIAWRIFEASNERNILEAALQLAEKSVRLSEDEANLDTYANLLYKLGQREKALEWEQKALTLNPDNADLRENYEKMKNSVPTWK